MPAFGRWKYTVDREATAQAYHRMPHGAADDCGCVNCRNFTAARAAVFPAEFRALADQLGIDLFKDAEVYRNAKLESGLHDYGGWFHFVGTLDETGDFPPVVFAPGFSSWMCQAYAPRLSALDGMQVVQLEFQAECVPWLLDEPEHDE